MISEFWESALNSEFVHNFVLIILKVLMVMVNLVLYPIGLVFNAILPELDEGLFAVVDYFDLAGVYMGWILDAMLLPLAPLAAIVSFYTLVLGSAFVFYSVKLAISWKQAIFK